MNTAKTAVKIEKSEDGLFHIQFDDGSLSVKGYKTLTVAARYFVSHNSGRLEVK